MCQEHPIRAVYEGVSGKDLRKYPLQKRDLLRRSRGRILHGGLRSRTVTARVRLYRRQLRQARQGEELLRSEVRQFLRRRDDSSGRLQDVRLYGRAGEMHRFAVSGWYVYSFAIRDISIICGGISIKFTSSFRSTKRCIETAGNQTSFSSSNNQAAIDIRW